MSVFIACYLSSPKDTVPVEADSPLDAATRYFTTNPKRVAIRVRNGRAVHLIGYRQIIETHPDIVPTLPEGWREEDARIQSLLEARRNQRDEPSVSPWLRRVFSAVIALFAICFVGLAIRHVQLQPLEETVEYKINYWRMRNFSTHAAKANPKAVGYWLRKSDWFEPIVEDPLCPLGPLPTDAEGRFVLGHGGVTAHRLEAEMAHALTQLLESPYASDAWLKLALVELARGQPAQSLESARAASKIAPWRGDVLACRSMAARLCGREDEALRFAGYARRLDAEAADQAATINLESRLTTPLPLPIENTPDALPPTAEEVEAILGLCGPCEGLPVGLWTNLMAWQQRKSLRLGYLPLYDGVYEIGDVRLGRLQLQELSQYHSRMLVNNSGNGRAWASMCLIQMANTNLLAAQACLREALGLAPSDGYVLATAALVSEFLRLPEDRDAFASAAVRVDPLLRERLEFTFKQNRIHYALKAAAEAKQGE